jgi:tetratricopeptide (TPR) repeat protein
MDVKMNASPFFVAGGALPPDAPSYVERPADQELFDAAADGYFCYVFAPHHMGKSSLMLRTAQRLQERGVCTAAADLSGFSGDVNVESPYLFLIKRLKYELNLAVEPDSWWAERAASDPMERFVEFLDRVVLAQVEERIVVFVDNIDITLSRDFLDSFLGVVRFVYQARANQSTYHRLTFVLLGTTILADLIPGSDSFPFDVGHEIDLREFRLDEARVLEEGLAAVCPHSYQAVLARIFHWTDGHPYLTQKVCLSAASVWYRHCSEDWVDDLVERTFLPLKGYSDPDLQYVIQSIKTAPRRRQLLTCYRRIYAGAEVLADEASSEQRRLKLMGLVRADGGVMKVRNQVYRLAFGPDWIKANKPVSWVKYAVAAAALVVLLIVAGIVFSVQQQRQRLSEAQSLLQAYSQADTPVGRLTSLAGLLRLRGQEDEARRLFFELSPEEQMELFSPADVRAMGEPLVTLIRGVYTEPNLRNDESGNRLLSAMAQPLPQLETQRSLDSVALELEISQWLKGREQYNGGNQHQRAIESLSTAIGVNRRNPGTYFDRALAYAAQGQTSRALEDFAVVLSLDEAWQDRIREAVTADGRLYDGLWQQQSDYRPLLALVPTPTSTSTPTATPSPTATPTHTSVPPTATATPTPTVPPTSTPSPSLTPTPSVLTATPIRSAAPSPTPAGAFSLLSPVSVEKPSYGPTDFDWEWTGPLPSGFGFEVRVWQEGEPPTGVHNAVLDNLNGNIKNVGGNRYRLSTDITEAAGIRGRSGIYWWTVALVQVSPAYADMEKQAEPARMRFESSLGGGDEPQGEGGVGID